MQGSAQSNASLSRCSLPAPLPQRALRCCSPQACGCRLSTFRTLTSCQASRASSSRWWRRTPPASRARQPMSACCSPTWEKVGGHAEAGRAGCCAAGNCAAAAPPGPSCFCYSFTLAAPVAALCHAAALPGDIAVKLGAVASMNPSVRIGSYPNVELSGEGLAYRVRTCCTFWPLSSCSILPLRSRTQPHRAAILVLQTSSFLIFALPSSSLPRPPAAGQAAV